ncbi:hypothetical protein C8R43DRAFT_1125064 [Mycena crocata]|nr:hypothetical protein C8R43DRAFT_1125064 [Mycena crocata]
MSNDAGLLRPIRPLDQARDIGASRKLSFPAGNLRLGMGLSQALDGNEPSFVAEMEAATKVAKERDTPIAGFAVGADMTKQRIDQGSRLHGFVFVFGVMIEIATGKAMAEAHMRSKANE